MNESHLFLKEQGYTDLREIPGQGLCGLFRFIFTTGLVIGITEFGYKGRFCFKHHRDAIRSLEEWNGIGYPSGDWIKYKGADNEFSKEEINTEREADAMERRCVLKT